MVTKRGILALNTLVRAFLIVVSFFIVLGFMLFILGVFEEDTPEQACRASITARANTEFDTLIKKNIKILPLACETQHVFIPEKDVDRASPEAQRDQIMDEIGELMAKCWWMFGNGQYAGILAKNAGKDQCHVCYSFTIPISYAAEGGPLHDDPTSPQGAIDGPISMDELMVFLAKHQYHASILYGGYANIGDYARFTFKPQQLSYTDRYGIHMDADRLLSSKARVKSGVADLAGLYHEDPDDMLDEIKSSLQKILEDRNLHVVLITAVQLPEEDVDQESTLAVRLIEEWGIGTELNNGIVFVFAMNNGVLLYGAETGASAVLPNYFIDEMVLEYVNDPMMEEQPAEAVHGFIKALEEQLMSKDPGDLINTMQFQNSYQAYITGGSLTSTSSQQNPSSIGTQGGIIVPTCSSTASQSGCQNTTEIRAGERYAIYYFSSAWRENWFDGIKSANVPNMIGIDLYSKVAHSYFGKLPCNINE